MDKYEYKLRSEEIQRLIDEEKYQEAVEIADTIDWRRVRSATTLQRIAALYRVNRRNEDSRDLLLLAFERFPTNRSILYSLCEVSIELDDVVNAVEYYKQFVKLAPRDNGVFTLRYKILEAQEASLEERIELLEELKKRDYQEEWGYELAYLYHRVGLETKCVEECDDIMLWFGDGPIVMQAMELKMLHTPLTKVQQIKYDAMKRNMELAAQGIPVEEETYAEDYYPDEQYADGMQETNPDGQYADGTQEAYPDGQYADGMQETNPDGQYADGMQEAYPDEQYADGMQETYSGEQYADGMQEAYPDEQYADGMQETYPDTQYADAAQEAYPDEQYADGMQETYPDEQYADETQETYAAEQYAEEAQEVTPEERYEEAYQAPQSDYDMSQYNTINLQKVVADSLKELLDQDEDLYNTSPELNANIPHIDDEEEQEAAAEEMAVEEAVSGEAAADVTGNVDTETVDNKMMNISSFDAGAGLRHITGEMYVEEVVNEWEKMKQAAAEKRKADVRKLVQQQTGDMFVNFENAAKSGLLAGLEVPVGGVPVEKAPEKSLTEVLFEEEMSDDEPDGVEELAEIEDMVEVDEAETDIDQMDADSLETEDIDGAEPMEELSENEEDLIAADRKETEEILEDKAVYADEELPEDETAYVAEELSGEETVYAEEDLSEEDAAYADEELPEEEAVYAEEEISEDGAAYADEELPEEETAYADGEALEQAELADDKQVSAGGEQDIVEAAITMDTAEISSIGDKIIETTKKETKQVKKEEIKEFSEEQEELFGSFAQTKKVKKQIINVLDKISLASYTGNVIITGEPGLGTVDLAKNIVKEIQQTDNNFSGKVAKISGSKLNLKDLNQVFEKINNGALIIVKANGVTEECLYNMSRILDQENRGVIVIMEDTKHNIMKLLKKQAMIADYFNLRIDLEEMNNDALVAYAKNYALEQEYAIDEFGILALYTRIADVQAGNHVVTVDEVKDIVDEAIWNSKRFKISNFVDVLFAKRYDAEDMIVLRERDFI